LGNNLGKNLVIAAALLAAGFFGAWLRFRPYLGTEGSFTDGVESYDAARFDRVRYAIWDSPEPFPGEANSAESERKPTISPDGRHLVFAVGERGLGLDLWIADLVDGRAVSPRPLAALSSPGDDLAPTFAGDVLWFASNRAGSAGGLDLWRSVYDRGAFGPPERVRGDVNTAADETDPAPVPGSDCIVFASNRGKIGAYPDFDLFAARPVNSLSSDALAWEVAPLAALNSGFDEREPAFTADGRGVLFASDREGGAGGFDLYRSGFLPGATIEGLGQGLLPPEPLRGVNGATDERGPCLSRDGFTLLFGVETVVQGRPAADLFRATSRELFRTPGRPVGWRELGLLLALLLLALLAALAKRWQALDVLYKCVLISLIVHVLLLLWARQVYPEHEVFEPASEGPRTRVRLIVDPTSLAAQRNVERSGEVNAARAERAETALPERSELRAAEIARELRAAEQALARAERAEASTAAPARRAVDVAAAATNRAVETAVATASETFERFAEASPVAVETRARDVRTERSTEFTADAVRRAATATRSDESPTDLAPSATARLERSSRAATADVGLPLPPRRTAELDPTRGSAPSPLVEVALAGPEERYVPEAASEAESGVAASSAALELAPSTDLASAPMRRSRNAPELAGPLFRGPESPAASAAASGTGSSAEPLGPTELAPLARASRSTNTGDSASGTASKGDLAALATPGFRAATVPDPSGSAARSLPFVTLVGPAQPEVVVAAAEPEVRFDPLAELAPGSPGVNGENGAPLSRADRSATRRPERLASAPAMARPDTARVPEPRPMHFDLDRRVAQEVPAALPERSQWDHTPYQSRTGAQKTEALTIYGGSEETERAVKSGLAYLASVQRREGHWGRIETDDKYGHPAVGKTGLVVLSFLGASHTPVSETEYSRNVQAGVRYLVGVQDPMSGHFGDSDAYSHGIATYALAECFALTKDRQLLVPLQAAVQHIVNNQRSSPELSEDGGWGYFYPTNRVYDRWPRASVTAWQVMALESAQLAGLEVPKQVFRRAASFLANSWDAQRSSFRYSHDPQRLRSNYPTLPGSTPASIFALSLLGADVTAPDYRAARQFVLERTPTVYKFTSEKDFVDKAQGNLYFMYYGTLAMFRVGGEDWQRWNVGMKETLLPAQEVDGSWKPISIYAEYAQDTDRDRVYTTAMCVLTLEVYYRYFTPLLKVE